MKLILLSILFLFLSSSFAEELFVPEILIQEEDIEGTTLNPYSTFKTENVSAQKFKDPSRQTLADLLSNQVGVDTQVYCANCGAKRLTINGLKGEHTSILIDGIPLHSAVSSFYGVDSIPLNGLTDVEVMRGAGASLTNPEAIGGTLNLITVNPLDFKSTFGTSLGVNDELDGQSQNHNFLTGYTAKDKKWGLVFGGQWARTETWDEDNNWVAELPQRESKSFMVKGRLLKGKNHDLSLRLGYSDLEILGGFHNPTKPTRVRPNAAGESDFVGGSVENRYLGDPLKITDWINLKRTEVGLNYTNFLSSDTTLKVKGGYARQEQDAIYQHGFDYANIDNMFVGDASLEKVTTGGHILKAGAFIKDQRLRSASQALFERYPSTSAQDIKKDSFDYLSTALYAGSTLFYKNFEVDLALRADRISLSWLELTNEISEWVLAPRLQVLHTINDHLTQRFSYGLGYRAPLTFFESQHGNEENGYEVDITQLEKAHSLVYSLSYNTPDYYVTGGFHYTHLKNMAFGFEEFNQPIRYRNSQEDYDIVVSDLLIGYKIQHHWLVEGTLEFFNYQQGYKRRLPTAAIEQRLTLQSTFESGPWTHLFRGRFIPSRNLSQYGNYPNHYVTRNQSLEPVLDTSLLKKDQESPAYATFDTSLFYKVTKKAELGLTIRNIFDYTQASDGDTPNAWHWHFNHMHYDGLHTWGPNAGREFILNFKYTL